jgi:hypothetical protein
MSEVDGLNEEAEAVASIWAMLRARRPGLEKPQQMMAAARATEGRRCPTYPPTPVRVGFPNHMIGILSKVGYS